MPKRKLDGRSLASIIKSVQAESPHPQFFWQLGNQWAVREGNWKLIGNPRDTSNKAPITKADQLFLSNLKEDVSELHNLAAEHPDVFRRLKTAHETWAKDLKP